MRRTLSQSYTVYALVGGALAVPVMLERISPFSSTTMIVAAIAADVVVGYRVVPVALSASRANAKLALYRSAASRSARAATLFPVAA